MPFKILFSLVFPLIALNFCSSLQAAERAEELLPASTVFFAEIHDPAAAVEGFLEHSYFANLQKLDAFKQLAKSPQYLQGITGLRFVEFQIGMSWQNAVKTLSAGGVSLAFDPKTEGVAVIFKGEDPEKLKDLRDKVVELARKDAENKGNVDPYQVKDYRGIQVYTTKDGGFLTYENWLIAGNKGELGKSIIDALLDGPTETLATNVNFKKAKKDVGAGNLGWAFIDLAPLRAAPSKDLQKLFSGKAENPAGELLLGGVMESLKTASHLSAAIHAQGNRLALNVQLPYESAETSELREYYFGPAGTGRAKPILEVPNMLFGLSTYRNVSEMWLRGGDLFNEQVNDGLAQADSNLSTFFSGKDFGQDILGALSPNMQILAIRQSYSEEAPIPAIKIPAFALLAEMKDPQTTTREFRRIYQSFIGFFNVVGAMNGQPQLELDFESLDQGELISATPIPELGEETNKQAKINFNFSPTVGFSGERLVIASSKDLARRLAIAKQPEEASVASTKTNTEMVINAEQLQLTLDDNRSHLIAQNILKEGSTREEATQKIGLFLEFLKLFEQADLQLSTRDSILDLEIGVQLKE